MFDPEQRVAAHGGQERENAAKAGLRFDLRVSKALVVLGLALLCMLAASTALAKPTKVLGKPPAPVVLHPTFHRSSGGSFVADNGYVFISGSAPTPEPVTGVVIDERTGKRTSISSPPEPGCDFPEGIGGSWLVVSCVTGSGSTIELYDIPTGEWKQFTPSPSVATACASSCGVTGIGADWIALLPACSGQCGSVEEFQNLETGQSAIDPRNPSTTVDLNSPTLSERVCSPLVLPQAPTTDGGWGTLTPDRGFTIAAGGGGAYLERCGSGLHEFLTFTTSLADCPLSVCVASNAHAIIWQTAYGRLGGIFLPSRQRFSIRVPALVEPGAVPGGFANNDGVTLALTSSTLYINNGNGQIWTTPSPSAPKARKPRNG